MSQRTPEQSVRAAQHSFVLEWGRMSSSWGINPTMAQIHALLFISEEPMAMDDIIENRPALSRWHPDFQAKFAEYVRGK